MLITHTVDGLVIIGILRSIDLIINIILYVIQDRNLTDLSYRSSTTRTNLSQNASQQSLPNIPEPTIIDFSQRFDDSPLLDDSDIIPLD
mgnify:FL=1